MTLAVLSLVVVAAAALADTPLSAGEAVTAGLERSPILADAEAAVRRAEGARRAECGLRHDPTVNVSTAIVGEAWSVSATQPLSVAGEGRAACAEARRALEASRARLARKRLEVAAGTRRAWVDAVAAAAREDLAADALEAARTIERAAGQRLEVGEASELDLRLALLTVEQARAVWLAAAIEEGTSLQTLATAAGVAVDALVLPADPLGGVPKPSTTASAASVRSDVAAARAEVEAARAGLGRARAATLAPVSVGVFVEEEDDELRAGPALAVTLPLWRANVDGRASAGADLAAAEVRAEATALRVGAEQSVAQRTHAAVEAALQDQPEDLPTQARAALDGVELGYARGELDSLSAALLQAEILDGQLAWIGGRRLVAVARIDAMLARDDPALLGGAPP